VLRDGGVNGLGEQVVFWEGDLSLPKSMVDAGVVGLWFDTELLSTAILADPGSGLSVVLPEGAQSPGNGDSGAEYPNAIAARYNFPFADPGLAAPGVRIGLIEPGQGPLPVVRGRSTSCSTPTARRPARDACRTPSPSHRAQAFSDAVARWTSASSPPSTPMPASSSTPAGRPRRQGDVHRLPGGDLGHGQPP
jgi:hypothetical protein